MDGKLLWRLYLVKQSASASYYKILEHYFGRHETVHISDLLKFDQELETLFQ